MNIEDLIEKLINRNYDIQIVQHINNKIDVKITKDKKSITVGFNKKNFQASKFKDTLEDLILSIENNTLNIA